MSMEEVGQATLPQVVNSLLRRFITDLLMQESHKDVTCAYQEDVEDELDFRVGIMMAYHRYRYALRISAPMNLYIHGFIPPISDTVISHIHLFPREQLFSMSASLQAELTEDRSHRAVRGGQKPSKPLLTTVLKPRNSVLTTPTMHCHRYYAVVGIINYPPRHVVPYPPSITDVSGAP